MKKLLCLLLAALMLLPALGCASGGKTDAGTTAAPTTTAAPVDTTTAAPETEPPIISAALPDENYEGYNFVIACYDQTVGGTIWVEEEIGETINDAIYDRNRLVEERFNVSVMAETLPNSGLENGVRQAVAASDDTYALVSGHDCTLWSMTMGGNFLNLRDLKEMDFSQPWYPAYANNTYAINNRQYMFTGYVSYLALSWAPCFLVNKALAADNGITIPYQEVFDGKWTLDRLAELTEGVNSDLNGDGRMDDFDRYGLALNYKLYSFQGAYLDCYSRDAEGRVTLDFDKEKLVSLAEKVVAIAYGPYGYVYGAEPSDKMFLNNQSLFHYVKIQFMTSTELRESDIEYGILPIPKWDEAQQDYVSSTSDRQFVILTSNSNPTRTAVITEALASAGYNRVRESYFDVALQTKFVPDRESREVLDIISNTLSVDLSFLNTSAGTSGLGRVVMLALSNGKTEFGSLFAKLIPSEQKTVDKINAYYFKDLSAN